MPSRSQACMRLRPAVSPPWQRVRDEVRGARAARRREVGRDGTVRGAPWISRRGSSFQARQNGREDRVGLGLADVGDEVARACGGARRPPACRASSTRWSRRIANGRGVGGEVDRGRRRAPRPASAAPARACRGRSTRFPPRCWSASRRSLEALEHEPRAAVGSVAAVEQAVVEDEDRARRARRRRAPRAAAGDRGRAGRAGTRRGRSRASIPSTGASRILDRPCRWSTDFPLFPLGLVALPSELVPLHIFEERYKAMIGALPRGGVRVRDRLDGRRRPAADRLRVRDRRGAGAAAGRPDQPRRARDARVPDRGAPGRSAVPGGHRRVPRRPRRGRRPGGRRGRAHRLRRPRRAGHRPHARARTRSRR